MTNQKTTTLIFPNEMWQTIGSICAELKTDRSKDGYDRSAWVGTEDQWVYVCAVLTYKRTLKKGSEKRRYTNAISTVEKATPAGKAKRKEEIRLFRAAQKAARAARK
tara:strand:+ start:3181 stop:3501 length:321 start_codon:yes stop_codon:yes gene_type:complete